MNCTNAIPALLLCLMFHAVTCAQQTTDQTRAEERPWQTDLQPPANETDARFRVKKDLKDGYIGKTGKMVIPAYLSHDPYMQFSEGLAVIEVGITSGYMGKTGQMVIPAQYREAQPFSEGLASVRVDDGYVDKGG